jgi:TPR repeat protein
MVERAPLSHHRAGPYESRRQDWDIDRDHSVPLFISDSDGEPDPSEYIAPLRTRRRASLSTRILAVVCAAAAVAVLFALFSSDAMRDLVNVKASMVSLFPAPSAAASSSPLPTTASSLPAAAPPKDPVVRLASPGIQMQAAQPMTMASVTPSQEEMKSAYQSALQGQPPIAAPVPEPAPPVSAIHHLNPDEIVASLKRAGALIASGDIAAARLVLRPVAEDGDAQASVMLAESYDPQILDKLVVHGIVPDVAMARHWYEAAIRLGSAEANQRLELLASRNR